MKDGNNIFKYILGGMVVAGYFVLLYLLLLRIVPEQNRDLLNLVVGALIGSFAAVVQYFFGSSSGSAKKDETISAIASNKDNEVKESQ
jgi:hypothetical protein